MTPSYAGRSSNALSLIFVKCKIKEILLDPLMTYTVYSKVVFRFKEGVGKSKLFALIENQA